MEKTIYAKQCPPNFNLFDPFGDGEYDDIIIFSNRNFQEHIPEQYEHIFYTLKNDMDFVINDIEMLDNGDKTEFNSLEDLIIFYFPELDSDTLSKEKSLLIRNALISYNEGFSDIEDVLEEIYGEEFIRLTLRGCSQGDWVKVAYKKSDYPGLTRQILEADYFGLYDVYEIHAGDNVPTDPSEVFGYHLRVYSDPKKEISEAEGVDENHVKIFTFRGYKK